MRLLLLSDTQTDFANLDNCKILLQEILKAAQKYKPDAIIHAGDVKEQYNPIDARVAKFWVRATRKIVEAGNRFIILLGNHDRLSQSPDSKNWLDILRAAGAETFSKPRWTKVGDGNVAFLPFTADKKLERKWASSLSEEFPEDTPTALVFHTDVKGAEIAPGVFSSGNSPETLGFPYYDICLGGHLHQMQMVTDNSWYVGSPFCHDWSEANQQKGIMLVTVEPLQDGSGVHVRTKHIPLPIPGWFDASYLEENNLTPEPGSYIRSRVSVTSKKITEALIEEEKRLIELYGSEMQYFVIPKLVEDESAPVVLTGTTDDEKVAQYVAATWPSEARASVEQGVSYLSSCLPKTALRSSGLGLRFVAVSGHNVLPFESVEFSYENQGLVLIKGINRDWHKRSNGSGKTSLLSLLTLAWDGTTIKDQKHDDWMMEGKEKADVSLHVQLVKTNYYIERYRPHGLRLGAEGRDCAEDLSSGLTGNEKNGGTQGLIHTKLGFDRQMLLNSVYIDQTVANSFVYGSQKDRMDLIGKLLDLQRFEIALKVVAKDIEQNEKAKQRVERDIELLEDELPEAEQELAVVSKEIKTDWEVKRQEIQKEVTRLVAVRASYKDSKGAYDDVQRERDDFVATEEQLTHRLQDALAEEQALQERISRAEKLLQKGICPRCEQKSMSAGRNMRSAAEQQLPEIMAKREKLQTSLVHVKKEIGQRESTLRKWEVAEKKAIVDLEAARQVLYTTEEAAKEEEKRNQGAKEAKAKLENKVHGLQRKLKACRGHYKELDIDRELLEYAKKAFHRSGMPMYLAAALCPVLNKAAEEYSEMFNGGKVRVRFAVEEGEFTVEAVNPAGSQKLKGQSVGEAAMAGAVAAFALREASPKTNLLILDEPGHGLDPQGAKEFAQGLLKLKDRFETILLVTHNPVIEGILAGEKTWTVVKSKGKSNLEMEQ